ncbi:hypothetical protein L202_07818 [Cryptococcus amylolentus CBS 6039]|uniref:NAD+ kinase n=2 Tax=Cryptococcus amylolentus TaxID=104669 RepID=A0A1E3HAT2_9TREE|nr:hypothetical protein L202_07818 [Cryptococcus amylolentus CBS 6039]ODN73265.1 hypothetical protein L202_07818 [Cryptococcus amylolentus CBS 6039]ODN99075.1 hypothetical protein I350_07230 [Cryptococcus amylolentus CBS 6273]
MPPKPDPSPPLPSLSSPDSRPSSTPRSPPRHRPRFASPSSALLKRDPSSSAISRLSSPALDSLQGPSTSALTFSEVNPLFIHAHLDRHGSLADWLKQRLYKARERPSCGPNSKLRDAFSAEEDGIGTLSRQLAETAQGVRDMSKELGETKVRSRIQNVLIVTKNNDEGLIKLTRDLALYLMQRLPPPSPEGASDRYGGPSQDRGMVVYVDIALKESERFDAAGIERHHPELFQPMEPRRTPSSTSVGNLARLSSAFTSASSLNDGSKGGKGEDGQLRYWTSDLCANKADQFDLVITLGGDGTVLLTSWLFQSVVPPVLPFALGSLGFLTNFDFSKYKAIIDKTIDEGIRVNLRMRFRCTIYRRKGESTKAEETFEVLNDVEIDRGFAPYISSLELYGDDHHLTTVQADGLIVSTPTGSTAYSLSAGGSLVHPQIPATLITPICPHTLSFRPMLLPDSMELRVCVPRDARSTAWASFDGKGRTELHQGDHIKITASRYPFPTICADKANTDWFSAIARTLLWNERAKQKTFTIREENGEDGQAS